MRRLPFLLAAVSGLLACSHIPLDHDALSGKDYAVIESTDPAVRIAVLDGHYTTRLFSSLSIFGTVTELRLTPGDHVMTVHYFDGYGSQHPFVATSYDFALKAEAGRVYKLNAEAVWHSQGGNRWHVGRVWITDWTAISNVGSVLASRSEPVTPETAPFTQSMYFGWAAPKGGDWIVQSRNHRSLGAMVNDGPTQFDNSYVRIVVAEIPSVDKPEEFLEYVKKRIGGWADKDSNRFKSLDSTIDLAKVHNADCVRYHYATLDQHPERAHSNVPLADLGLALKAMVSQPQPIYEDVHGYACPVPNNKNLIIDFTFSSWAYDRPGEATTNGRAEQAFSGLQF